MQLDLRILELDLQVGNRSARGVAIGGGGVEGAPGVRIIESGEELAFPHPHAFVKKDAGDAPRDFGGNSRAPPGSYIAAGVQQGLCLWIICRKRTRNFD